MFMYSLSYPYLSIDIHSHHLKCIVTGWLLVRFFVLLIDAIFTEDLLVFIDFFDNLPLGLHATVNKLGTC